MTRRFFSDGVALSATSGSGQAQPMGRGGVPMAEISEEAYEAALGAYRLAAAESMPAPLEEEEPTPSPLEERIASLEAQMAEIAPIIEALEPAPEP